MKTSLKSKFKILGNRLVAICIVLCISININISAAGTPAGGIVYDPSNFVKNALTAASSITTKFSTGITAMTSTTEWAKKLADFSVKKIAKKLAIDIVNRMSACIEGVKSACKTPLYLSDPAQYMANIASSEINNLAKALTADVNNINNELQFRAQVLLMDAQKSIQKRIAASMHVMNEHEANKAAAICSQNYINRVRIVEGDERANYIIATCNNMSVRGSYIKPGDIDSVNNIIATSKTPLEGSVGYFGVFNNTAVKASNVESQIAAETQAQIDKRKQDEKDRINAGQGYIGSRECLDPVGGTETNCLRWKIITPGGQIASQDVFNRLQPIRSWETVNSIEDFVSVAGDQIMTAMVNRAAKEGSKVVTEITTEAIVGISTSINSVAQDITSSIQDANKDLQCTVNDQTCQTKKQIATISSLVKDDDKKYMKDMISQSITSSYNDLISFRKGLVSKSYYRDKLLNVINVINNANSNLDAKINYYNTSASVANNIRSFPLIAADLQKRFNDLQNKKTELNNIKTFYEQSLGFVNKDINDISKIEVELLNLVGDRELYPDLYKKSVFNQCLNKVDKGEIKNVIELKSVFINSDFISPNIDKYKNIPAPTSYSCNDSKPTNGDFDIIKNSIVLTEEGLHEKRYMYEQSMKDPNQAQLAANSGEIIDDTVKLYNNINVNRKSIETSELINHNPETYMNSIIKLHYPPLSTEGTGF